ncbi:HER224Cp [Eremothecium sinecaudum]|uniref:Telomerase reverse transcriptase n=1 Tax=Eremothecium sinecaudum TaxID=45286 RepID=A0A0X8HU05_9SACH|nr:HER224Cp [Eremothecium sinecaudum]AMD21502.1 HER224Cp [Eremothecium sinecaudum]
MKCLEEFINDDLPERIEVNKNQLWALRSINCLKDLLKTHFIIENPRRYPLPQTSSEHGKMIDQCVVFLVTNKLFDNVLTYGYNIANNLQLNASIHCDSINSSIATLKTGVWELLHEAIGTRNFVFLVINCSIFCYYGSYFKQIVGNAMNEPNSPPIWYKNKENRLAIRSKRREDVGNTAFLYRNYCIIKWDKLLAGDMRSLRLEIFESKDMENAMVDLLISKMLQNTKRIKYMRIINSICPRKFVKSLKTNLDAQTNVKSVTRLIIILIDKLIPLQLFGNQKNKAVILKRVSELLLLNVNSKIPFEYLTKGIKLKDVGWLDCKSGNPRYELQRRRYLMEQFLDWLYRKFLPRIVSSIFYATEISSQVSVVYYRQDDWRDLSLPFLASYFGNYLEVNRHCTIHDSFKRSEYNHKNLRLIPKKAKDEFRVIAVPYKGVYEDDKYEYDEYIKTTIKPIHHILGYLRETRETHFEKLSSPMQIGKAIKNFKTTLIEKYGKIPPLYYVKFDIATCYDSIPKHKVFKIVDKLVGDCKDFYIRKITVYDTKTHVIKHHNVVNGHLKMKQRCIIIDKVQTIRLSKQDIFNTLSMEIEKTAFRYYNKCYLRKNGLFQGSQLSSCIVDIVYDDLLEYYPELRHTRDSLVLRLADDFLVLSIDREYVSKILTLASEGFKAYNATINKHKILTNLTFDSSVENIFSYCAINIDITKLEVWKTKDSYNLVQSHVGSTKKLYKKLRWLFELRMSYEVTSTRFNSWEAVVKHIAHAITNLAESFSACFSRLPVNVNAFSEFIDGIIISSCQNCQRGNDAKLKCLELQTVIVSCFKMIMMVKRSKFAKIIKFLEDKQNEVLTEFQLKHA